MRAGNESPNRLLQDGCIGHDETCEGTSRSGARHNSAWRGEAREVFEMGYRLRQKLSFAAVGEETEVADAHEALGEQMQEEAAQELIER